MTTTTIDSALLATPPVAVPVTHKTRHGATDVLRMAAVVPVVFYHAGLLAQLPALIGMHALIAASVMFAASSRSRGSAVEIISKRAARLLVPWLFFGVLHLAMAAKSHAVQPWMLLIGGSMHLWFVPFIFVVTCAVALACRAGPWPKTWGRVLFWSALALGTLHVEVRVTPMIVDRVPLWQFLNGATAVLVALAVLSTPAGRRGELLIAAVLAVVSIPLWLPWRTGADMLVSPAGVGALLFLLVGLLPAGSNRVTGFLGRASFGLYLMHPFVQRVFDIVAAKLRHVPIESLDSTTKAACTVTTIIACLIAIAVLERTPARRIVT